MPVQGCTKGYSSILKLKGCHPVGALGSAEKGGTVRGVRCFSASGAFMPPMLIVPRKRRMQQDFQLNVFPGAWIKVYETGWMTKPLFCTWFKKFIGFLGAWKGSTVLFLLGKLGCCTKSLQLISTARGNRVTLLCFPPHCTHRLQPLDVAFMKLFSLFYEEEVEKWFWHNAGKVFTLFQMSSLF